MSENPLKKLAGQTAIYGLPTILGRMLHYALVPFFTYIFGKPADFGLNIEFYAYISFLNILFSYGMETALFNFSSREPDKNIVYSTALRSIVLSTVILCIPFVCFAPQFANILHYPGHGNFIIWAIMIVGTDALAAIPFAKLREENKARRFAKIKFINIGVQLLINFFFVGLCKYHFEKDAGSFWGSFYNPEIGIGYAFIAGLMANVVSLLLLLPEIIKIKYGFNFSLWKRMLNYSLPLLIVGFAGMTNETLDRILLKHLLPEDIAQTQVGIYGACYKISILMTLFVMAFRYAAEPFFFARQKDENAKTLYGSVMTWFVLFCLIIFLGTTLNISWIQYFVGPSYREGLKVVPILLLANLFLGIYFNLSIWYKLTGRTKFGMWIPILGAIITIALNFLWIPSANSYFGGYMGSAWATLICYGVMMVFSYLIGQKYYPVDYAILRIFCYLFFAIGLYFTGYLICTNSVFLDLILKNSLLLTYLIAVIVIEKPMKLLRGNDVKNI